MRGKKAFINSAVSLLLEFVTVVCGFIIPRLIIGHYGSDVNGLTSSITQFLSYIALAEAGANGVIRAALYKPLACNDNAKISGIVKAGQNFFRTIAYVFVGYMVVLAGFYPVLVNRNFSWLFSASMVLIIGLSTFAQYYFGTTYTAFVQADQSSYITSSLQICAIILNAIFVVVLIKLGANIHVLKLGTALVYVLRSVALYIYVNKKYKFDKTAKPDNEAIKQRWDGLGHHIALFVNLNTDVVILTVFSKLSQSFALSEISVYSVYYSVVYGVKNLTNTLSSGVEAALGNMIANKETDNLKKKFGLYEFMSYFLTTVLFTSTEILILPFMRVYTTGITDADYVRPDFAAAMVLAYAVYCVRIPYNSLTFAAGHYKQTRNGAFAEAGINIFVSVLLVRHMGIVGVAVGTLVAMTFRTVQYARYLSKNILHRSMWTFIKRITVSLICAAASMLFVRLIVQIDVVSYFSWAIYAIETVAVTALVTGLINYILSRKDMKEAFKIAGNIISGIFEKN